jgi:peptidoglycan/LPS O-acetylase OafA/YrhL
VAPGATAMPPKTDSSLGYRAHLDGLRAVAVLLVIAFHAGYAAVPGGFIGVDVFFVLSGYLITRLLVTELTGRGHVRLARFYARRMRRLLPASALTLAGVVAASAYLLDRAQQLPIGSDVRWSALWMANWHFVQARADYFAPGDVPSPVVHYWTLAVEEQFYVVWPALLLALWALFARRARRPTAALVTAVAVLAGASAVASVVLTPSNAAYYGTHTRAYQLLSGALVALVLVRAGGAAERLRRVLTPPVATAVAGAGLVLLGACAVRIHGAGGYPGWPALVVTGATVLVLVALECGAPGPAHRLLGANAPAAVGRVSYSLYLWHWPVLVFAPLLATRWHHPWLGGRPAMFAAMGAFAMASYLLVERPIRFRVVPKAPSGAVIACGLALSSLVAVAIAPQLLPSGSDEHIALAAVRDLARPEPCPYFAADWHDPATAVPCTWRTGGKYTVALVGDSHAQMWQPALDRIAEKYDLTIVRVTRGGCPANDVTVYHLDDGGAKVPDHECTAWRAAMYPRLIADFHPDLVLVSTRSHVLGIQDHGSFLLPTDPRYLPLWTDAYVRSLRVLASGGARVLVSAILPSLPERVPACLAAHGLKTHLCDWPVTVDKRVGPFNDVIRGLPAQVPGVAAIDPTPLACPGGTCTAVIDGIVVHRDDNHLSATYVATLADRFEALLRGGGATLGPSGRSVPPR